MPMLDLNFDDEIQEYTIDFYNKELANYFDDLSKFKSKYINNNNILSKLEEVEEAKSLLGRSYYLLKAIKLILDELVKDDR